MIDVDANMLNLGYWAWVKGDQNSSILKEIIECFSKNGLTVQQAQEVLEKCEELIKSAKI